jgi:hypothetical protein
MSASGPPTPAAMTGVSGLPAVARLLRRRLLLLIALYIAVLTLTVLLLGAWLWSAVPYGWAYEVEEFRSKPFFGFGGRNRLLLTFAPTFAVFYWVSTLGLALAIRRRHDGLVIPSCLVMAWPLWSTLLFWSLILTATPDEDALLLPILLCGTVFGLVVAAAGVALRRWWFAFAPLTVNVLWVVHVSWYFDEFLHVFGD